MLAEGTDTARTGDEASTFCDVVPGDIGHDVQEFHELIRTHVQLHAAVVIDDKLQRNQRP
jgi:hypothetical protein